RKRIQGRSSRVTNLVRSHATSRVLSRSRLRLVHARNQGRSHAMSRVRNRSRVTNRGRSRRQSERLHHPLPSQGIKKANGNRSSTATGKSKRQRRTEERRVGKA